MRVPCSFPTGESRTERGSLIAGPPFFIKISTFNFQLFLEVPAYGMGINGVVVFFPFMHLIPFQFFTNHVSIHIPVFPGFCDLCPLASAFVFFAPIPPAPAERGG
jgi:hypothetical protein